MKTKGTHLTIVFLGFLVFLNYSEKLAQPSYKFEDVDRLIEAQNYEEALRLAKLEVETNGMGYERALYKVGELYSLLERYETAEIYLLRFLREFPSSPYRDFAHYQLGSVYLWRENPDIPGAKREFSLVVGNFPRSTVASKALYALGLCYLETGKKEDALKKFEQVVINYPEDTEIVSKARKKIDELRLELGQIQERVKQKPGQPQHTIKILSVVPSQVFAGGTMKVSVKREPQDLSYEFGITMDPNTQSWSSLGETASDMLEFSTQNAKGSLTQKGSYYLVVRSKTKDGREVHDKYRFNYTPWPEMSLSPLQPSETLVKVRPGDLSELLIEIENHSPVDFNGNLRVRGPCELSFRESGSNSAFDNCETKVWTEIGPAQKKVFPLEIKANESYQTGQYEDILNGAFSTVSSGISDGQDIGKSDLVRITLETEENARVMQELAYHVVSAGGENKGQLTANILLNQNILGELTTLKPGTEYNAEFEITNKGNTLIFLNTLQIDWPKCLRVDRDKTRLINVPKPWSTEPLLLTVVTDLLSAIIDPTSVVSKALTTSLTDLYMGRYFVNFLEVAELGVPIPPGQSCVFEVDFVSQDKCSDQKIEMSIGYDDFGKELISDPSTMTAAAIWEGLRVWLTQGYTPISRKVNTQKHFEIKEPVFQKELEFLNPLEESGYRISHTVSQHLGFFATTHCPVDLHLYDQEGRHVGKTTDGSEIEIEIPGAQYATIGDAEYVFVPNVIKNYRVVVKGKGEGTYSLDIAQPTVVQLPGGSLERILVPLKYPRLHATENSVKEFDIDCAKLGRTASEKMKEGLQLRTAVLESIDSIQKTNPLRETVLVVVAIYILTGSIVISWLHLMSIKRDSKYRKMLKKGFVRCPKCGKPLR